jgi:hypothetical protein
MEEGGKRQGKRKGIGSGEKWPLRGRKSSTQKFKASVGLALDPNVPGTLRNSL